MALKSWLKANPLFAFNLVNRDLWVAEQAASLPAGSRVLDMGAGSCPYRPLFAHCRYETQDFAGLDDVQLRHGGYGRIDYRCDIASVPVADGTFDAILCTEVLEHVREPIKVVQEMARILKPGGRLDADRPPRFRHPPGAAPLLRRLYALLVPRLPRRGRVLADPDTCQCRLLQILLPGIDPLRADYPPVQTGHAAARGAPVGAALGGACSIAGRWGFRWFAVIWIRFDREQRFTVGYHVTAIKD